MLATVEEQAPCNSPTVGKPFPGTEADRERGRETQRRRATLNRSLSERLSTTVMLSTAADLLEQVAKVTKSLGDCVPDSDQAEAARAQLGAVSLGARTWDCLADRVRILKGEPMPGARKPAPEVPKVKKKAAVAYGGMD